MRPDELWVIRINPAARDEVPRTVLAIAARRKALADPMPDPSDVEEGVYAD